MRQLHQFEGRTVGPNDNNILAMRSFVQELV
jgi:hypothetical protein